MRAFDPEVKDAVWSAIEGLIPVVPDHHPLGCHRRRVPDRICFEGMLIRLVTGCSWQDAEALLGGVVSDTTMRARRDEWLAAGVFSELATEAICAYDKVIGLDLSEAAVDGSLHKAPAGGEGTGKNPTDRAKLGWKWSIVTEKNGIPIGWTIAAANRNDCILLNDTLECAENRGLLADIETLWLDRGYDSEATRSHLTSRGVTDAIIAKKRRPGEPRVAKSSKMGLRWPVERTNSWLSNFGQLRRNTDRRNVHRGAQLALAVAFLLTAKLIDWRNRWTPDLAPIR